MMVAVLLIPFTLATTAFSVVQCCLRRVDGWRRSVWNVRETMTVLFIIEEGRPLQGRS
jgi:hypothetical protein